MPFGLVAAMLAVGFGLLSTAAAGQTTRDVLVVRLFELALKAVDAKHQLPPGRRVVALDDPLLKTPARHTQDVQLANRRFAEAARLAPVALREVLVCTGPRGCSFTGDIAATASFRLALRQSDSAVVLVATRHFLPSRTPQAPRWQAMAVYEVWLARRNGAWTVVGLTPRAES